MAEPGSIQDLDEDLEQPERPLWFRIAVLVLIVAMIAFLFPVIVRLFLPPINPAQPPPPGHFDSQCAVCHEMTPAVAAKTYLGLGGPARMHAPVATTAYARR